MSIPTDSKPKVIIIDARDHETVADELLRNVVGTLKQQGVEHDRVRVMTLSSIPAALSIAMEFVEYDGAILLGYDIPSHVINSKITNEVVRLIHEVAIDLSMPIGLGIVSTDDSAEAVSQAAAQGTKAALQCLELMRVRSYFLDNSNDDVYHTFNV